MTVFPFTAAQISARPIAMTDLDLAHVVSIAAGHAGTSHVPVLTVTEEDRGPRIFQFRDAVARDAFMLRLVDACEELHHPARTAA